MKKSKKNESPQNTYSKDIEIDQDALDVEWIAQPTLLMKYVKLSAVAKRDVEHLRELLSLEKAKLDKKIRKCPDEFGIYKITETVISSIISADSECGAIHTKILDAQFEVNMINGAILAMEHKKQALENLSKLLSLSYFSAPKAPRDLQSKEVQKQLQRKINSSITF